MRKEITALREKMKLYGFDAYMIPTSDFHQSEYVHDHFKCREYVSGFTGSAGTLIVTMDEARLWTDGRYFLQAAAQLEGSGISLMKMGCEGVPTIIEYLDSVLNDTDSAVGQTEKLLAFDGRICTVSDIPEDKFTMITDCDLVGEIWTDRPEITPSRIYPIDISVSGETHTSKLARLRNIMAENNVDYHVITRLDEIAWLYNLRGNDVKHTPVFFAYALITSTEDFLYIMDADFEYHDSENVILRPYDCFFDDLRALEHGRLLADKGSLCYALIDALPYDIEIVSSETPISSMKAIKNKSEIESTKNAHLKDGAAMAEFLYWLKNTVGHEEITELDAAAKSEECRMKQDGFKDLSFETISAYGSNGAIIHYSATEKSNKTLAPKGFYLVDSGGQYEDGTTDITRTVALGELTDEMKLHYTTVLKCHIALCRAIFKPGTTGAELDALTRAPLHEIGMDYNHGTGHGVGHLLGCHEGPQAISTRDKTHAIMPGMINSDEPGVYIEGEYGIRLENEILCIEKEGQYGFEPITFCPFDRDAILPEILTDDERDWLNEYHHQVYEKISPLVSDGVCRWLENATVKI